MKKIIQLTAVAACLILCSTISVSAAVPKLKKEKVFTADEKTATTSVDNEITEDGIKYSLTNMEYTVVSSVPSKKTETTTVKIGEALVKTETADQTLDKDGVQYTLKDITYTDTTITNRAAKTSSSVAYGVAVTAPAAPSTVQVDYRDSVTGQTVQATLPLKSITADAPATWIKDVTVPIKFALYDAEYYTFGTAIISRNDETPPLDNIKSQLLQSLQLSGEHYRLDSFAWDGAPYVENNITYRNAVAVGQRLVSTYTAYYSGAVALPDAPGYTSIANYTAEVDDAEKPIYTIKATATYAQQKSAFPIIPVAAAGTGVAAVGVFFIIFAVRRKNVVVKQNGKTVYKTRVRNGRVSLDALGSLAGASVIVKKSYTSKHLNDGIKVTAHGNVLADNMITKRDDTTIQM